ncbi:MAG: hypothetical protein ACRD1G_02730, partial [Acidimicrobiales bacterium]
WLRVDILGGPFMIASWPGLALAIGALVTSPARPLRLVAVALTLGAYAVGGAMMLGAGAQRPNSNAVVAYIDRVGANGDPIVSQSLFANPLSELDVSLADTGTSKHHPVIRLGSPPLAEQLSHLADPHPQTTLFGPPVTPPALVARQAAALAPHGTIFLVSPSAPVPILLKYYPNSPVSLFYRALPPGFRIVGHLTYSGFSGSLPESVFVFRG